MRSMPQSSHDASRQRAPDDLDAPFAVSKEQAAFFRDNGYIKLKGVLSPQTLQHYGAEITRLVLELSRGHLPLDQRSTY
ncbi:MAG: hypothetical protein ACREXP_20200, partial [Steroidobacteraceae bacterium]